MLELYTYVVHTLNNVHLTLGSVFLGLFLRQTRRLHLRKWISTMYGLFVLISMYREQFWHYFLTANLIIFAILYSKPENCHIVSTSLPLAYITIFRIIYSEEIPKRYFEMNLLMMVFVAKMSGIGYDIRNTHTSLNKRIQQGFEHDYDTEPKFWDLFHFTFCHIESVSGLFYRYRTYDDFMKGNFSYKYKNYTFIMKRLVMALVFLMTYLLVHGRFFPSHYMKSKEFKNSSFIYILFYGLMQGISSRLWMLYLMFLGEFVLSMTGFGVYPSQGDNIYGHGPTKNYQKLMSEDETEAYDVKTIQNADLRKLISAPWVRDTIRSWNLTYQYWFSNMIQRTLVLNPKYGDRAFDITMIIDVLWHGINPGMIFASFIMILFILSMRYYWKISTHIKGNVVYLSIIWILKECYCCFYALSCVLYHFEDLYAYYGAVYYFPIVFDVFLFIFGKLTLYYLERNKCNKKY